MNSREEFEKRFSELCVISEEEKTYKGDIKWHIPDSEIKKYYFEASRVKNAKFAKIESSWLSIGSPSYCSFYISVYPSASDVSAYDSYPPKYVTTLRVSIVFKRKLPDCAWVKGEIYLDGIGSNKHVKFSVSAKDFDRKIELDIDGDNFYATTDIGGDNFYSNLVNVDCHCSIKISLREVKCAFDNEKICYGESRNYDSAKETFKHDSLSDVKIRIGSHLFTTHKTLLARINAFQDLFNDNASKQCFELANIEPEIFKHVLIFLYSGNIPKMSFKLACKLYIVASDLKIYDLGCLCSAYLGGNLTETNVTIVLKLSDEYKDIDLKKECFKFIKRSDVETETLAWNAIISVPPEEIVTFEDANQQFSRF